MKITIGRALIGAVIAGLVLASVSINTGKATQSKISSEIQAAHHARMAAAGL